MEKLVYFQFSFADSLEMWFNFAPHFNENLPNVSIPEQDLPQQPAASAVAKIGLR